MVFVLCYFEVVRKTQSLGITTEIWIFCSITSKPGRDSKDKLCVILHRQSSKAIKLTSKYAFINFLLKNRNY